MRLITATRGKIQDTLLFKSVARTQNTSKITLCPIQDNTEGLSKVYNRPINDETLCFCHDDVAINDYWWVSVVELGLMRYDIVGVAGNTQLNPDHASWCHTVKDPQSGGNYLVDKTLSGMIAQGAQWPAERVDYFGPCQEVKLLDGVFLAVKGKTLLETGLRFDEDFNFHFYDLAFCRRALNLSLRLGTIPLSLTHNSLGKMDATWRADLNRYRAKYDTSEHC
jgi:GT2 family glycosyltransferase